MLKALLFDVFGTVVDWRTGVAREAEILFNEHAITIDPYAFADTWRAKYQPAMEKIRKEGRTYVELDALHLENLENTLGDFDLTDYFDDDTLSQLNRAWEKLPAWPDSSHALTKLKNRYRIATCSNGSIPLMNKLAKYADLPWDDILGAPVAKNYKPEPVVYLASVSALHLKPENVMMAAAHNGDLAAARKCGLKTAFFPRSNEHGPHQTSDLIATSDWDYIATDLNDLANQLL